MKENPVEIYIAEIIKEFNSGQAREHAYRPALKKLFESIVAIQAINDPARSEHGAPDFALMKTKELSVGYAEAKDVTEDLDKVEKSEQMKRYFEYGSLILTNSLEFRFYRHGDKYDEPIVVAKIEDGRIVPQEAKYNELEKTIKTFLTEPEWIKSSTKLAKIMGDKGRRIRDKVQEYVSESHIRNDELRKIYESFKKILIHDLTGEQFADMYAQTLVYGLFAARYEDDSDVEFTRSKARDLVPASNPFLRKFFDHIVGADFDIRLAVIVNELCQVFNNTNVHELMHQYATQKALIGSDKLSADPVIHFYEDFLKEYDPEQRKKRGAFYTPLPVVKFIIRAVDHILEKDFGLAHGLADTTKIDWKRTKQGKTATTQIHKVQILDPATGTGTFLNEVVKNILARFVGQEGRWKSYVDTDLLPRLHGFELMMAPYTIAHLKIAMTLHDSGYTDFHDRLGIYLTNSLEEGAVADNTLFGFGFGQAITEESQAAAEIKNDTPIMVVIGNPPYSGESSNAHYTGNDVYKIEPSGGKLQERNSKWLNDDYVKFIRFAESMIEKNGEGIVAMITAHGYIDNPTFRGMRHHLMQTFEKIYILDLHGNANKKEKSPDGSKDENVFNIKTGVSIFIGIKYKGKSSKPSQIFRSDFFGTRNYKFLCLDERLFEDLQWKNIIPSAPNFEWVSWDEKTKDVYMGGFSVVDLFVENGVGVTTAHDTFVIDEKKEELLKKFELFKISERNEEILHKNFNVSKKTGWNILEGYDNLNQESNFEKFIVPITYRPFDNRYIFYEDKLVWRTVRKLMRHMIKPNIGLVFARTQKNPNFDAIFISKNIIETKCGESSTQSAIAPLYLYSEDGSKIANLKKEIVDEIEKVVSKVSPEDIFDYIYAVLYSPNYREKYKEFLKIDFPRVPYPKDKESFDRLVMLGRELRGLHLLESQVLNKPITTFPVAGSDIVESKYPKFEKEKDATVGKVYVNETQFFGNVPEIAWNFYIGGYQPAQKWLKDRRTRTLSSEDLQHYQKMIVVLTETDRIMKEIDRV